MIKLLKIAGVIGGATLLFILYPYYVQYSGQLLNIANGIYGSVGGTMSTLETLFFSALPLIGLILILWIGWKALTGNWRR
jgi:phosphoglycerol transferase MdoB-like AlkP superfamily enzyme